MNLNRPNWARKNSNDHKFTPQVLHQIKGLIESYVILEDNSFGSNFREVIVERKNLYVKNSIGHGDIGEILFTEAALPRRSENSCSKKFLKTQRKIRPMEFYFYGLQLYRKYDSIASDVLWTLQNF